MWRLVRSSNWIALARLGPKWLKATNILAYCVTEFITRIKSFAMWAPGVDVRNLLI